MCYAAGRGQKKMSTYCTARQCRSFFHVGTGLNCFKDWNAKVDEYLLAIFALVTYWTKIQHQFMPG